MRLRSLHVHQRDACDPQFVIDDFQLRALLRLHQLDKSMARWAAIVAQKSMGHS